MKCLVTGGSGFIGSHIVERLIQDCHDVIVIDDESAPENETFHVLKGAQYVKQDIADPNTHSLYEGVDFVFHLAARSRIQPTYKAARHTFENNVIGTQSVLEASANAGVKRVIYSGSSSFYGRNTPPHVETMSSDCLNPYSLSKLQGEQICELYAKMEKIEAVTLRYFNVYGPREPLKGHYAPVIGIFKRQASSGSPLTIVGDGMQSRDFTHVYDVVEANMLAAFRDSSKVFTGEYTYEVFNIGTGTSYTICEIANMVSNNQVHIKTRPGEARATRADNRKACDLLGWKPTISLKEALFTY